MNRRIVASRQLGDQPGEDYPRRVAEAKGRRVKRALPDATYAAAYAYDPARMWLRYRGRLTLKRLRVELILC